MQHVVNTQTVRREAFRVLHKVPEGPEPLEPADGAPYARQENSPGEVVFVCDACRPQVENGDGPIESESGWLRQKAALLVSSSALCWVIENRAEIVQGFLVRNRSGVSATISPDGSGFHPPFGAVGNSGRKYYFVPRAHLDKFVEVPAVPSYLEDGVGGPACDAHWVRFMGRDTNILNRFIELHGLQGSPGGEIGHLAQDR